ncbi:MAG: NAD(P)/FAD-dependent oxidoreductase [Victivallales bacterium]|nr:NAD(P)/FAD-dependent oxidoreductase [Victivallales bacterium]
MDLKVKYLVVGASYAGSLLSAKLAPLGETMLVDRSLPGDRMNCGGGIHAKTFKKLEVDIPFVEAETILMSVLGRDTSFPCSYVVVDRALLNKALFDKAVDAGAKFAHMSYVERDESAKIAKFRDPAGEIHSIEYDKLIFADGFRPKTCRILQNEDGSLEPIHYHAGAAKVRIVEAESNRKDTLYFQITKENPCGYSWAFPMPDGRINIGAGGFGSSCVSDEWIDDLMEFENLKGPTLEKGGGVFPLRPFKRVQCGDVYLFGDAAGMVYALNGEGLKHIADSVDLWATFIVNGGDLNPAWRRSSTYLKLIFASKALRGIRKLSRIFNRPIYPSICRLAAFTRRIVRM